MYKPRWRPLLFHPNLQTHEKTKRKPLFIQNQQCHTAVLPGGQEVQAAFPSHTREMSPCWKTPSTFPPFPADSKHLLLPERKSKPNWVQPHPLPACCDTNSAYVTSWQVNTHKARLHGNQAHLITVQADAVLVRLLLQKRWQKYQLFCWRQLCRSAWTLTKIDSCLSENRMCLYRKLINFSSSQHHQCLKRNQTEKSS